MWKYIIPKSIAELHSKYGTSCSILDFLQPYIAGVEGRKIALAVLRDNVLIVIYKDNICF